MTEKSFETAQKNLKGLGGTPQGLECCFLFFADIARQLTIANEIAIRKAEVEGIWKVTEATPAPDANIRFEILAKAFFYDTKMMAPGKSIAAAQNPPYTEEDRSEAWRKWLEESDIPEPAPDALVGVCRDTIARLGVLADIPQGDRFRSDNIKYVTATRENLIAALATHEKAVR